MRARFIPDEDYTALIEALLSLKPASITTRVTFEQIAMALGDKGNIWPQGIQYSA